MSRRVGSHKGARGTASVRGGLSKDGKMLALGKVDGGELEAGRATMRALVRRSAVPGGTVRGREPKEIYVEGGRSKEKEERLLG